MPRPNSFLLIWSGRGSKEGTICDAKKCVIPEDIFKQNNNQRSAHIIISVGYGEVIKDRYRAPKDTHVTYWNGVTNSNDLHGYLISDSFDKTLLDSVKRIKERNEASRSCSAVFP